MLKKKFFNNGNVREILNHYKAEISPINVLDGLLFWDSGTYMPKGVRERGQVFGYLSRITKRAYFDPKFMALIKKARDSRLNKFERRVIELLERDIRDYKVLPDSFIDFFEKTRSNSMKAWQKAKKKNDFKIWQSYLVAIFEATKRKVDLMGYKEHPYNPLLDIYEEGLTVEEIDKFFGEIRRPLQDLFNSVVSSSSCPEKHPLDALKKPFKSRADFLALNHEILSFLGHDSNRSRFDIGVSPFTVEVSFNDVRITTREDFSGIGATVHELGHLEHALGCHEEFANTPLMPANIGMALAESQGLFWQNFVGRSKAFCDFLAPKLSKLLPSIDITPETLYRYSNLIRPTLIRVTADEISYHFHIMIRYEIEKAVIEGSMKVSDIPAVWNEKMKEYLGVVPTEDIEGPMQDAQWPKGRFGYFPTYSYGAFLAGMFKELMEKDFGITVEQKLLEGKVKDISGWLGKNVHQYGALYNPKSLLANMGKEFSPRPLLRHLENKYK